MGNKAFNLSSDALKLGIVTTATFCNATALLRGVTIYANDKPNQLVSTRKPKRI